MKNSLTTQERSRITVKKLRRGFNKDYYALFFGKRELGVISFPCSNPYLKHMSLSELAEHEVSRILESEREGV